MFFSIFFPQLSFSKFFFWASVGPVAQGGRGWPIGTCKAHGDATGLGRDGMGTRRDGDATGRDLFLSLQLASFPSVTSVPFSYFRSLQSPPFPSVSPLGVCIKKKPKNVFVNTILHFLLLFFILVKYFRFFY